MGIVYGILTIAADTDINDSINIIICDTSLIAINVALPASPEDGTLFYIKDLGNASVNNIINYATIQLLFCSTNDLWLIL